VKNAETTIAKLVEVALRRYSMIEENDRILIAVSGGKDSLTLAYDLAKKQRWWPVSFELKALHIVTDLPTRPESEKILDLLHSWGLETGCVSAPVIGRLKPGRSMNCYWCSTQRRTELIRYAMAEGFNAIALGHHLDDAVETLLMNMLYKRQISGMLPVLKYEKYPLKILRPLILCEERKIEEFIAAVGIDIIARECTLDAASKRREVRRRIEALTGGSSALKRNLFDSMSAVNSAYLPRPAGMYDTEEESNTSD
jgi:tRNA 2-thiocytidine biosynthesis protein TtcA